MNLYKTVFRFKFFDMPVSVTRSSQVAVVIVIVIATSLAVFFSDLTPLDALIAGILAAVIHWVSYLLHQYGHFSAAKRVGKPSTGIKLWWVLGGIRYPRDEGELSPQIHIQRALGGPAVNAILLVIALIVANFIWSYSPMTRFLMGWVIFSQFLFSVGSLFPISYGNFNTDGGTLLQLWLASRRQAQG